MYLHVHVLKKGGGQHGLSERFRLLTCPEGHTTGRTLMVKGDWSTSSPLAWICHSREPTVRGVTLTTKVALSGSARIVREASAATMEVAYRV
jgi:hypothetical protein